MIHYIEPISYLLISVVLMYGLYRIADNLIQQMLLRQREDKRQKQVETILPLRIQAYERMCLFLERITPNQLLLRVVPNTHSALQLQQTLLSEIREEYNHNIAQQLYLSIGTWEEINNAMNEIVTIINKSASEVSPEEAPTLLAKKIIAMVAEMPNDPPVEALKRLKTEFSSLF
ncbi:hypothetical protein CLV98_103120 [Dyadobacter jejuensis]|uniref:Uncharacterized protein n=1 Tax=Dyadobacter jejuensis TaxID=1082580 RepID=A0A316ALY1_9BACT|nr:hypothetical protein [Dyadobacter jejuensis]PWJ58753.1 hypothetical protein CLV98_103120 [Dyadobacter jejuensis]